MAVQTQMQVRRGTAASWTSTNPTLAAGEWGLETDTGKYKIGNGTTAWASLAYAANSVAAGTGISVSTSSGVTTVTNTVATAVDAKGDLVAGTGADTFSRLAAGANETRLVADSAQTTGLKYVADTTNYAIGAKGDLLVGTAADTVAAVSVGANGLVLTADSTQASGVIWTTVASSGSGGGTFKIASGSAGGAKTYTISLPTGGYVVKAYNSLGYGVTTGVASIDFTFGSTVYKNYFGNSTLTTSAPNPTLVVQLTSTLSSVTIDTSASAGWTSASRTGGFGTTVPSINKNTFAFGNSIFNIAGSVGTGTGLTRYNASSTDGVTWTSRLGAGFGNTEVSGVRFGGGIFFGIDRAGNISTSANGTTWTNRASNMVPPGALPGMAYVAGISQQYLIANTASGGNYNSSTDGVTWVTRTGLDASNGGASLAGHNNFATAKVLSFAGGSNSYYYSSTDGITWTSRAFPTSTGSANSGLATDGSKYVWGGAGGNIYSSTDGITWTAGQAFGQIQFLTYNATPTAKWVGTYGSETGVASSTDGVTWFPHKTENLNTMSSNLTRPDYGNGKWIVEQFSNMDNTAIWTSTDGIGTTNGDIIGSIVPAGTVTTL